MFQMNSNQLKNPGILILTDLGATTESCRVASTNPVNICRLSGIFRDVGAYMRVSVPARLKFLFLKVKIAEKFIFRLIFYLFCIILKY